MHKYENISDVSLGDTVIVEDDNYRETEVGRIVGIYDRNDGYFKNDVSVVFKKGCKPQYYHLDCVRHFPKIETRNDIWKFIKDDSISGENKVAVLRILRDRKVIDINLKSVAEKRDRS